MDDKLRNLLLIGGLIGVGYVAFNRLTSEALPLKFVCKLAQEIKHQMLIVSINYASGCQQHIEKMKKNSPSKLDELYNYFKTKLAQIYSQKQDLILNKYSIPKQKYAQSLQAYKNDSKLQKIQDEILQMMEKSVNGQTPNLTVDKRASSAFTKQQIKVIYEDMSKMILVALVGKLQTEKKNNPYFDSNNDAQFKKVIRQLNIYDKKIQFFKQRGFKQQWGCPNQTFFKISEGLKIKDPAFKIQMQRLQQIYQKAVDIAALKPEQMNIEKINQMYIQKQPQPQVVQPQTVNHVNPRQNLLNNFSAKIAAKIQPQPQKYQKQQEQPISLNKSTKSQPEPEVSEQKPSEQIFQSIVSQVPAKQTQNKTNQVQRSESAVVQPVNQPIINENQAKHIPIDDVPNDALELQKQMQHNHQDMKPACEQKTEVQNTQQNKKQQKAESNVSVDGQKTEQTQQV